MAGAAAAFGGRGSFSAEAATVLVVASTASFGGHGLFTARATVLKGGVVSFRALGRFTSGVQISLKPFAGRGLFTAHVRNLPPAPPLPSLGGGRVDHAGGTDLGYQPAPLQLPSPHRIEVAASQQWVRRIAEVLNNVLTGKMNVTLDVTLTAGAATTTILDARLSSTTVISFCPLTATAAAEMAAGTMWVSSRADGVMILTHANSGVTDRIFDCSIIG